MNLVGDPITLTRGLISLRDVSTEFTPAQIRMLVDYDWQKFNFDIENYIESFLSGENIKRKLEKKNKDFSEDKSAHTDWCIESGTNKEDILASLQSLKEREEEVATLNKKLSLLTAYKSIYAQTKKDTDFESLINLNENLNSENDFFNQINEEVEFLTSLRKSKPEIITIKPNKKDSLFEILKSRKNKNKKQFYYIVNARLVSDIRDNESNIVINTASHWFFVLQNGKKILIEDSAGLKRLDFFNAFIFRSNSGFKYYRASCDENKMQWSSGCCELFAEKFAFNNLRMVAFNKKYRSFKSFLSNMKPNVFLDSTSIDSAMDNIPNLFYPIFNLGMIEKSFGKLSSAVSKQLREEEYFTLGRIGYLGKNLADSRENKSIIRYSSSISFNKLFIESIERDKDMLESFLSNPDTFQPNSKMLYKAIKNRDNELEITKSVFRAQSYLSLVCKLYSNLNRRLADSQTADYVLRKNRVLLNNINTTLKGGWIYHELLTVTEIMEGRVLSLLGSDKNFKESVKEINKLAIPGFLKGVFSDESTNGSIRQLNKFPKVREILSDLKNEQGTLEYWNEKNKLLLYRNNDIYKIEGEKDGSDTPKNSKKKKNGVEVFPEESFNHLVSVISSCNKKIENIVDSDFMIVYKAVGLDPKFMINLRQFIPSSKPIENFTELANFYSEERNSSFRPEILFATRGNLNKFAGSGIVLIKFLMDNTGNDSYIQFYSEVFDTEKESLTSFITNYQSKKAAFSNIGKNNVNEIFTQFKKSVNTIKYPILRLDSELKNAFSEPKEINHRVAIAKKFMELEEMSTYFGGKPDFTPIAAGAFVGNEALERTFQYEFLKSKIQSFVSNSEDDYDQTMDIIFIYRSVEEFSGDIKEGTEKQQLVQQFETLRNNKSKVKILNDRLTTKKKDFVEKIKQKFSIDIFNPDEEENQE